LVRVKCNIIDFELQTLNVHTIQITVLISIVVFLATNTILKH